MDDQIPNSLSGVSLDVTPEQLRGWIRDANENQAPPGLSLVNVANGPVELPETARFSRVLILDDDLVLVQQDGTVLVLVDGAEGDYRVQIDGEEIDSVQLQEAAAGSQRWGSIASVPPIELADVAGNGLGGGQAEPVLAGDPLKGYAISPLLPFTDYPIDIEREFDSGFDVGSSPAVPVFAVTGPINLIETDADLPLQIFDHVGLALEGISAGESISKVALVLPGLPVGTVVSAGVLALASDGTLTLQFSGSLEDYQALSITFPEDFSTVSRNDRAEGDLVGRVTATTNFGDVASAEFTLGIAAEGDVEIDDTLPDTVADETDGETELVPASLLLPVVTDKDGSETLTDLTLVVRGLPGDGSFSLDNGLFGLPAGASVELQEASDGSLTLTIGMEFAAVGDLLSAYEGIRLVLPVDFSTANRSDLAGGAADGPTRLPIELELSVQTDEDGDPANDTDQDGTATATRVVDIDFEPDITLTAAERIEALEDDGFEGLPAPGVTVAMDIDIDIDDIDGSETAATDDPRFAATVTITFDSLPSGVTVNAGTLAGTIWTGSVAEAEALELHFPGNYAGAITAEIVASTPEGSAAASQILDILPVRDIEVEGEIVADETDDPLSLLLADFIDVLITDPAEELAEFSMTLPGLPAGMAAYDSTTLAAVGTFTDAGDGTFTFVYFWNGAGTRPEDVTLEFPADYSTTNPATTLLANIVASTTEAGVLLPPVSADISVIVNEEGDLSVDASGPDTVPDETDASSGLVPSELIAVAASDADGSEIVERLVLTINGLPGDGSFTVAGGVTGIPAGANVSFSTAANGSGTLMIELDAATVGDVEAAYAAIALSLPADFSTANRSDLTGGDPDGPTSYPITVNVEAITDEDQDPSSDTANDGQANISRVVEIGFEADIELSAQAVVTAEEDEGVIGSGSAGITDLPLPITIGITDADGSETASTADSRFAAMVEITFQGLPSGASFNGGTLFGQVWTGSAAEAEALTISLPADFFGTIPSTIVVTTPEGSSSAPQEIVITPTPDVEISGAIVTNETDAPVGTVLSDFITVMVTDTAETVVEYLFTLPGLPAGTQAIDITTGNPVGSFSGGTFEYHWRADGTESPTLPENVQLIFPADFSTTNPDAPLTATLTVTTEQGGITNAPVSTDISVTVNEEADLEIQDSGPIALAETDAAVVFSPSDYYLPVATDADGSESVDEVSIRLEGLPVGTAISYDDGGSFALLAGSVLTFTGTLAEYEDLLISLPTDFSTENPAGSITGSVTATTDEGGSATTAIRVTVSSEGDLTITDNGPIRLDENDAPGNSDEDATNVAPIDFKLVDAVGAVPDDADGSEGIATVAVVISGLPSGTMYSTDNGGSFAAVPAGANATFDLDNDEYQNLVFRLPDDFSTESPASTISGSVTFTTDEAILAGETDVDDTDGVATVDFSVEVTSEADVDITAEDTDGTEDIPPYPLGLDAAVVDVDGSESITEITVFFDDLPTGTTELNSGAFSLTGPSQTITVADLDELRSLTITSLPEHYSGIIAATVKVVTDEGGPAGTSRDFEIRITPVAEPELTVSVDAGETGVDEIGTDQDHYVVKEDGSFLLQLSGTTPDKDGSENLARLEISNIPAGWLTADGSGNVDLGQFEGDTNFIDTAILSGTTLTITFVDDTTDFATSLRLEPLPDDDRDLATIIDDSLAQLEVTLHGTDTAVGLSDDTAQVSEGIEIDVDAVVDDLTLATTDTSSNENTEGRRDVDIGITDFGLTDTDGSEVVDKLTLTFTVVTESDVFDPAGSADMRFEVASAALRSAVDIVQTGSTTDSVTYEVTRAAGATDTDFEAAIESLRLSFPTHFSGVVTTDGEVEWNETTTPTNYPGDLENDATDNANSQIFQTTITINPVAEAELTFTAFVRDDDLTDNDVETGAESSVSGSAMDGASVSVADILTLRETTLDGSGPGTSASPLPDGSVNDQVQVYLGIDASTPDTDGSEQLEALTIRSIPSDWLPASWNIGGAIAAADWAYLTAADGSAPLDAGELAKIDSIDFDTSTGTLTIAFKADVTAFEASLALEPTPYEDWDVDASQPYIDDGRITTSAGQFYGGDIVMELTTSDDNSVQTDTESADVTVDIDVSPVNNRVEIVSFETGNEAVIDATNMGNGGTYQVNLLLGANDQDGSENITAVVIRDLPQHLSIYVPNDPSDLSKGYSPARITSIHTDSSGATVVDWSLSGGSWEYMHIRGIPLHFAGELDISFDAVTTEYDGGGTGVTSLTTSLYVDPVVDGGSPSGSGAGLEDQPFRLNVSANIIDNATNSSLSPEFNDGDVTFAVSADAYGRYPTFFLGEPTDADGDGVWEGAEITLAADGTFTVDSADIDNVWMVAQKDWNVDSTIDVTFQYFETLDPSQTTTDTATIQIDLTGVADRPEVFAQEADPDQTSGTVIALGDVNAIYRAGSGDLDGDGTDDSATTNFHRLYGYAGGDDGIFTLTSRLTDEALELGVDEAINQGFDAYEVADPLSGMMTEILHSGAFDGSETIYYIVSGIPDGIYLSGGSPIDETGSTYLFTGSQLADIAFVPTTVTEVTYYDLTFNALVTENDVDTATLSSYTDAYTNPDGSIDVAGLLTAIDGEVGAAVGSTGFTVVVVPAGGDGGGTCPPEDLDVPSLRLVGDIYEDQPSQLKLVLNPGGGYDSIDDLLNLPYGVVGDLGLSIQLPAGASLSTNPPGGVVYDPFTNSWAIDLDYLIGSSTGLESEFALVFTPPPHQSSPVNPFGPADTFGDNDPYDSLDSLSFTMILNNYTCDEVKTGDGAFPITIIPVVDGPSISVSLTSVAPTVEFPVPEDVAISLDIAISGPDGGERLDPTAPVVITIDGDHIGGTLNSVDQSLGLLQSGLYDGSGNLIDDGRLTILANGDYQYTLGVDELDDLTIIPKNHVHGDLTVTVEATSEDVNGDTRTSSGSESIYIDAVADEPLIIPDESATDPETGLPIITIDDNGTPLDPSDDVAVITAVEDQKFFLGGVDQAFSPDTDGSESVSAVILLTVPDEIEIGMDGGSGIIDNGDGTYTISANDFQFVWLKLAEEHARTPDTLDPSIPDGYDFSITLNTYELSNGSENTGQVDYRLTVRPDADMPTLVSAEITPTNGTEDQSQPYTLSMVGFTPDPHETMEFMVSGIPDGGQVLLDGVALTVSGGSVFIPSNVGATEGQGVTYLPGGVVTFVPPADFAGKVDLQVTAITTDDTTPWDTIDSYVDQASSTPFDLSLDIAVAPDLTVTVDETVVSLSETDAVVSHIPSDAFTISVSDADGSESVDAVTYTLTGVPADMDFAPATGVSVGAGVLTFTGSLADWLALELRFPADFAGDGLVATLQVSTNEGGNETVGNTINIAGEVDLDLAAAPDDGTQIGTPLVIDLGISAEVTPLGAADNEWVEEIVVTFDDPLPLGTSVEPTGAVLSADRQTLTLSGGTAANQASFALLVASLAIVVPGEFDGVIAGTVEGTTNHGSLSGGDAVPFSLTIADDGPPVVSGPVDIAPSTDPSFTIPFADLLANASDADTPMSIGNVSSSDPDVGIVVLADSVEITVPVGFIGTPSLDYDVVGGDGLTTAASANLDIDTMQMVAIGTTTDPDGASYDLMGDVAGGAAGIDVARATDGNDAVIYDNASRTYDGVEGFNLLDGNDFVDLSGSSVGYEVDMGGGDDWAKGSAGDDILLGGAGNDRLEGGEGSDTLTGGAGDDVFVLGPTLGIADVITDYEAADKIDLTVFGDTDLSNITLSTAGELSFEGTAVAQVGASGGSVPAQVEVIFSVAETEASITAA